GDSAIVPSRLPCDTRASFVLPQPGSFRSAVATFDLTFGTDLTDTLTAIGIAAATTILGLRDDAAFRSKPDASPVRRTDEAAEAVIRERLTRVVPDLPIVSEEEAEHTKAA